MSKIKLTKGELKKQRDSLKQFKRYLPTLQLKKQQLQMKILEARRELTKRIGNLEQTEQHIKEWAGLLGDQDMDVSQWVKPVDIQTSTVNVAGANIPVLQNIEFAEQKYDLYETPFWVDQGIEQLKKVIQLIVEVEIIKEQIHKLEHELRVTTQRVNLFEKIKIPECNEHIRVIRIYLGDQQANAVGISKVAKKKIEDRELEMVGA